ncbi:YciI family protein [Pararcticibacter amylolyticus]|uniref:YciI family protein n=1 Tax=Pararcticibacter amylolyticus TaxID=2173175 RepID=UPI00192E3972|nr:YciI family protein [Pararcticibacter amylolyticus]
MTQYLVTGTDFTDEKALERRMAVREKHLEGAKALKANNNLVLAGAFLNEDGKMAGSSIVVQFETEDELKTWLDNEPYVLEKVWEKVDVKPFRIANV